jgi:hypothetical protein
VTEYDIFLGLCGLSLVIGIAIQWRPMVRIWRDPGHHNGNPMLALLAWGLIPGSLLVRAFHAWPMFVQMHPAQATLIAIVGGADIAIFAACLQQELAISSVPKWRPRAILLITYLGSLYAFLVIRASYA